MGPSSSTVLRAYTALSDVSPRLAWLGDLSAKSWIGRELAKEAVITDGSMLVPIANWALSTCIKEARKCSHGVAARARSQPQRSDIMAELSAVEAYANPEKGLALIKDAMRLNRTNPAGICGISATPTTR
jgi:hypothetical protein